jgi:hypothetical protein
MEKLQNRLVDMREAYEELGPQSESILDPIGTGPPAAFFEADQPHVLLGIANVFLQVYISLRSFSQLPSGRALES